MRVEVILQAAAIDQLHDDKDGACILAGLINRDRVRVIEFGGGLRLAEKTPDHAFVLGVIFLQQLDRDLAVLARIDSEPDHADGAFAEFPTQDVRPNLFSGCQLHRRAGAL